MNQRRRQNDARPAATALDGGRYLDWLVALLTTVVTLFYLIAPSSRHGMLITFFIPVCVSGFYVGAKRSALIAGICAVTVCVSFVMGGLPDWPTDHWTQALTLALWSVSLGCCSVCVSGMSNVQVAAMAKMQRKHVSERLIDGLTGLKNRLAFDYEFQDQLDRAQQDGSPVALLMVDVDHFKKFNDRHGHSAGDFVLREVAKILASTIREIDVVARYGGEEFVILLPNSAMSVAQNAAERIRGTVQRRRFHFEDTTMRLTVSVGVAVRLADEPGDQLIDRADAALYTSKHAGRNCVHYHDGKEFRAFGSTLALYTSEDGADTDLDAISEDAYSETVTGLPHRRVFQEELKRRVAEAQRYDRNLTLIFVTIDGYEQIITMGADAEAVLLSILAEKLRSCLRDCDLGSRTGRYEFAALLPDTPLQNAFVPASRIEREISECNKMVFRGAELNLGASIGVAQVVAGDDDVTFIERARAAAHKAASTGGHSLLTDLPVEVVEDAT